LKEIFSLGPRIDLNPPQHAESQYGLLNRSASAWAERQRLLLSDWFTRAPEKEANDLWGRLTKGDDEQFESAVWELLLHNAYRRSGYQVTVHPDIDGSGRHPDCVVEGHGERFYLEAVRASAREGVVAEANLVEHIHKALAGMKTSGPTLRWELLRRGKNTPATRRLCRDLQQWAAELDEAEVMSLWRSRRFYEIPRFTWSSAGWLLRFTPLPIGVRAGRVEQSLVRGYLTGLRCHDDALRITAALDKKAKHYGPLDAPLVIAVLSNTESGTEDSDFAEALYGALIGPYTPGMLPAAHRFERAGHWCTRQGWRRSHTPQVISAQGLRLSTFGDTRLRLWSTPEPGVKFPQQPGWLAPVELTAAGPVVGEARRLAELFGLEQDWPGRPDFAYG
jgi:hypothetical protein